MTSNNIGKKIHPVHEDWTVLTGLLSHFKDYRRALCPWFEFYQLSGEPSRRIRFDCTEAKWRAEAVFTVAVRKACRWVSMRRQRKSLGFDVVCTCSEQLVRPNRCTAGHTSLCHNTIQSAITGWYYYYSHRFDPRSELQHVLLTFVSITPNCFSI